MAIKKFMIGRISADFEVELLSQNGSGALFYGLNGNCIHFVHFLDNEIEQFYFTLFDLALGFAFLLSPGKSLKEYLFDGHFKVEESNHEFEEEKKEFRILIDSKEYQFNSNEHKHFFKLIHKYKSSYNKAYEIVLDVPSDESIQDFADDFGSPVNVNMQTVHTVMPVIFDHLIAQESNKDIDSCYNRLWSLTKEQKFKISAYQIDKLLNQLIRFEPQLLSEELRHILFAVEFDFFQSTKWCEGKAAEITRDDFKNALKRLDKYQQTLLNYLIKEVNVFDLVSIGFVIGKISSKAYLNLITSSYQPDEEEEQNARKIVANCELFRRYNNLDEDKFLGYAIGLQTHKNKPPAKRFYFDPYFLLAREKAVMAALEHKDAKGNYEGITLSLVINQKSHTEEIDDDYEIRNIPILTGKRMHTNEILERLEMEAQFLKNTCGQSFPIMMTSNDETDGLAKMAVNQYYVSLYYFTVE